MKCPVCAGIDLKIAERQGVEIDYCPECRGVWLDRGELDKIIERSDALQQEPQHQEPQYQQPEPRYQQPGYNQQHHGKPHHDDQGYSNAGYSKRKSWLAELFD